MHQDEKAKLLRIKLSGGMDCLSQEERENTASFAVVLTAMDGIALTEQFAADIAALCSGSISYLTAFETILNRYGFLT